MEKKYNGGLMIRRSKDFNLALLLVKWCWRVLEEMRSLWYKVLCAGYGEKDGRLCFVEGRGYVKATFE